MSNRVKIPTFKRTVFSLSVPYVSDGVVYCIVLRWEAWFDKRRLRC